jgi:hypothetical protein
MPNHGDTKALTPHDLLSKSRSVQVENLLKNSVTQCLRGLNGLRVSLGLIVNLQKNT